MNTGSDGGPDECDEYDDPNEPSPQKTWNKTDKKMHGVTNGTIRDFLTPRLSRRLCHTFDRQRLFGPYFDCACAKCVAEGGFAEKNIGGKTGKRRVFRGNERAGVVSATLLVRTFVRRCHIGIFSHRHDSSSAASTCAESGRSWHNGNIGSLPHYLDFSDARGYADRNGKMRTAGLDSGGRPSSFSWPLSDLFRLQLPKGHGPFSYAFPGRLAG